MSKLVSNQHGTYKRTIVNPDESIENSDGIIEFICGDMMSFGKEKRVITSMTLTVNYCNTDAINVDEIGIMYDSRYLSDMGLMTWEESDIFTSNEASTERIRHRDNESTMRHRIVQYLNITCDRGMMDRYQYNRFANTIISIYKMLTVTKSNADVNHILELMELPYEVKEFPPTVACPDHFYKLVRIPPIPASNNGDSQCNATIDPAVTKKIDDFMKLWFDRGNGKICDNDRNEFYIEFMTMYESAKNAEKDDKGMIPVTRRRSKSKNSTNVMAMKELINYSDINKILKEHGLKYYIVYSQEVNTTSNGPKRKNSLSLKNDETNTNS